MDRGLGRRVVAALREAGAEVVAHDDEFPQDCPDDVWLTAVAERGWVVLTKDRRIAYHRIEQQAVAVTRARVFALVGGNLTAQAMAHAFVAALSKIRPMLERFEGPFFAKVYTTGDVRMWRDREALLEPRPRPPRRRRS